MGEALRDTGVGGGIGLLGGAGLGALVALISGRADQISTGLTAGVAGGLLYGLIFGLTCSATRSRSRHRRHRRFILARLPFLVTVCSALVFLPGALLGLLLDPGEYGQRHAVYSPLTITLGFLLSVYVGFLWVRLLRRGHG